LRKIVMQIIELLLFLIRIAINRIIKLFYSFPVMIVWITIIIACFIYAVISGDILVRPDIQTIVIMTPFLMFISLFKSFKNYNVMPVLMLYSKSNIQNSFIYIIFFIKQAFTNNVLLSMFNFAVFYFTGNKDYLIITLTATTISLLLSFLIMCIKNRLNIKKRCYREAKIKISPLIKSAIKDYVTTDFLTMAVICIALFLVVLIEITKDVYSLYELENPLVLFIGLTIILSIGFMGITDSIKNINWKFMAIISVNAFNYHIKRTMIFLSTVFGFLLLFFIFIGIKLNMMLLFKYLYCIIILFCMSIFIAFTTANMLIKGIVLLVIVAFTVWISTLSAVLLPILAIPLFAALLKSKSEYREWSLL